MEVKSKVDEGPIDAFNLVLLLLQDEHGVVEELLEFLIGVVDAELLKGVELQWAIRQVVSTTSCELPHYHTGDFLRRRPFTNYSCTQCPNDPLPTNCTQ